VRCKEKLYNLKKKMKQFKDINYARGYYDRLWNFTNTNNKILELEKFWNAQGKLELLRTPIPERKTQVTKVKQEFKKQKRKKHYNHLWVIFQAESWQVPTPELEDKEDEFINNYM